MVWLIVFRIATSNREVKHDVARNCMQQRADVSSPDSSSLDYFRFPVNVASPKPPVSSLKTNQFNGQFVLVRHFRKVFRDFIRIELSYRNLDGKFRKHSQCGLTDDSR